MYTQATEEGSCLVAAHEREAQVIENLEQQMVSSISSETFMYMLGDYIFNCRVAVYLADCTHCNMADLLLDVKLDLLCC